MLENESLLDKQVAPDEPKTNRRKLKVAFIAIIFIGLGALIGNGVYRYYSAVNSVAQYEKDYNARMEAERLAKMADTYGGKTPAETLSLYIEAVKKGDYELASKYFVEKNRKDELDSLISSKSENIANVVNLLDQTVKMSGSYSEDKLFYTIDRPLTVDFELYPNGIWKILKI